MSLDSYVENAWLKKEPTSSQEIADQLGNVARCMKDAGVEGISDDLRFYTTFNTLLALANTALCACGYRTTNQPGHHMRTIETLEYTIGVDSKTIRKFWLSPKSATSQATTRPEASRMRNSSKSLRLLRICNMPSKPA